VDTNLHGEGWDFQEKKYAPTKKRREIWNLQVMEDRTCRSKKEKKIKKWGGRKKKSVHLGRGHKLLTKKTEERFG